MRIAKKYARHEAPPAPEGLVSVPRTLGYARVSTVDQVMDVQVRALQLAGVEPEDMFIEKISSANAHRPQFNLMRKQLQRGDTLIVYSYSRLFRDVVNLLSFIDAMKAEGVTLRSTSEPTINPYTTAGRFQVSIVGSVDEHERGRVSDRTKDAMAEKKRQGMYLGRRRRLMPAHIKEMKRLRKTMTAAQIAKQFGCAVGTVYSYT